MTISHTLYACVQGQCLDKLINRHKSFQCTACVLLRPPLSSVCAAALHSRCHDIEERVRLQAVHTVHEVAAQHMDLTPAQVGSCEAMLWLHVGVYVCMYVLYRNVPARAYPIVSLSNCKCPLELELILGSA